MDSDAPYVHLQCEAGQPPRQWGAAACRLGHRVGQPGGGEAAGPQAIGQETIGQEAGGIFTEWSWDGRRLTLSNDRYGVYPAYYFHRNGEIAVPPSIPRLIGLGAPPDLNEAALAVFLRLGFFLGDDTPFRHIRALPPGADFRWEAGRLRLAGQRPCPAPSRLSRSAAIEGYIELFRQSIRRRTPPDDGFLLPLSGGKDSRHILLELQAAGHRPAACVTIQGHPTTSSEDVQVASRLTRELRLPHTILRQPGFTVPGELHKNTLTNFCTKEHGWFLPIADYLGAKTRVTYDGLGGDVLSAGLFLTEEKLDLFARARFARLAELLLTPVAETRLQRLLSPGAYARFHRAIAAQRLAEELETHAQAPNPVASFYFHNRTRRNVALSPYRLLQAVKTIYSPYLDRDLFDLLMSLPAPLVMDGRFHLDTLRKAYPACAAVPFARKEPGTHGSTLTERWPDCRRTARELLRYLYSGAPHSFVRRSFLLPRTLRACLPAGPPVETFCIPAVYLVQLERLHRDGPGPAAPAEERAPDAAWAG